MNDHFKPGILAAILYLYEPILLQMLIHVVFVMVFLIFFYLFISLIGSRYEFVKKWCGKVDGEMSFLSSETARGLILFFYRCGYVILSPISFIFYKL